MSFVFLLLEVLRLASCSHLSQSGRSQRGSSLPGTTRAPHQAHGHLSHDLALSPQLTLRGSAWRGLPRHAPVIRPRAAASPTTTPTRAPLVAQAR